MQTDGRTDKRQIAALHNAPRTVGRWHNKCMRFYITQVCRAQLDKSMEPDSQCHCFYFLSFSLSTTSDALHVLQNILAIWGNVGPLSSDVGMLQAAYTVLVRTAETKPQPSRRQSLDAGSITRSRPPAHPSARFRSSIIHSRPACPPRSHHFFPLLPLLRPPRRLTNRLAIAPVNAHFGGVVRRRRRTSDGGGGGARRLILAKHGGRWLRRRRLPRSAHRLLVVLYIYVIDRRLRASLLLWPAAGAGVDVQLLLFLFRGSRHRTASCIYAIQLTWFREIS